jgi:DNA-binding NarL/FixJ family response regulator
VEKTESNNQSFMGHQAERAVGARLTFREREILYYAANGNTNKQIASILKICDQTVRNHMTAIFRTLNANNRAHAVFLAMRGGWISAEEAFPEWSRPEAALVLSSGKQ